MRILLDESLPVRLIPQLESHEVRSVVAMGWTGIRNGALLRLAAAEFEAFLTVDQNLEYHQNLANLPIAVIVLLAPTNRIESLEPLLPAIFRALESLQPNQLIKVSASREG